ncbi:MAG: hypothetical protein EZS28_010999 [Streblomastix strix]|uniref:Uncharacterized protein n=1 Tax=Streblomastix strix TaxID=222440 RepID=A0A5J4WFS2_9EUKA|nr:MAG: hypothetical protein EZS28_010999 [Streblomastix strix]
MLWLAYVGKQTCILAKPYKILVAAQSQPTFVYAFHQNIEIYPLDPDQTIAVPEEIPSFAIKAALALLAELSGQGTLQIDFYLKEPSEEQVFEAKQ